MPQYSLRGYVHALNSRTNRTLIVEGASDRKVIARIVEGLQEENPGEKIPALVIDTAEIVKAELPIIGNRAIIEHIHSLAHRQDGKIAALVDREYRNFQTEPPITDSMPEHAVIDGTCFWTRGHSTENYFLDERFFAAFLAHQYSERLPSGWREKLTAQYPQILSWSAAISLSIYKNSLIEKSTGVIRIECWQMDSTGRIEINFPALNAILLTRQVSASQVADLEQQTRALFGSFSRPVDEICQWISHGHIGTETLWSGIGYVIAHMSGTLELGKDISSGHREDKLRFAATVWSKLIAEKNVTSPLSLWQWIKGNIETK